MDRQFKKIKVKDGQTILEWDCIGNSGGMETFSLKSYDAPKISFMNTLLELRKDVANICDFPKEFADKITVNSVSLSWSSDDTFGAVISSLLSIDGRYQPICINTPYLKEDSEDSAQRLPSQAVLDLYKLIEEANDYLEGDRETGDLFREAVINSTEDIKEDPKGFTNIDGVLHSNKAIREAKKAVMELKKAGVTRITANVN